MASVGLFALSGGVCVISKSMGLPATTARCATKVAAAPIVERHRTLEPVVEFVRRQSAQGCEIAIATLQSDDPGGITFYLGRDIKVFDDEARAAAFLAEGPARGLLVRRSQVERISALVGGNVRALTVPHPGRRAQDYALLVTDAR